MKLIIDIPKHVYNYIRKYEHIANSDISDIKDAIINSTPLPKGHINLEERPQGDCEYEEGRMLKRMSGGYVTYKVEYLLNNLAREICLLESYRRWKESKVKESDNG